MKRLEYQLRFLTPAFLGDGEQSARWRTPPLKHLLREWWRVVWAAEHGFPNGDSAVQQMRHEEGLLFGHAWLEDDQDQRGNKVAARKSLVRLRLDQWTEGKQSSWKALPTVKHPEVKFAVGSDLYLGYGPLTLPKGAKTPALKGKAVIQAGESATFAITFPTTHKRPELKELIEANAPRIERALWLMNRYGTLGGRSRNGWGSFCLTPSEPQGAFAAGHALPLRPWRDCLDRDWPHAIGCDQKGPLIWQTASHQDWRSLMKTLAVIKVGLRTQFVFPDVKPPHTDIESRHWLSYPITTHRTRKWGNGMRLPNQLYFKIRQSDGGNIVGAIFHIPHLPPPAFCPDHKAVERTWEQVHALLDHINSGSPRTYPMIPDDAPARRRSALKPHIDSVTLERIAE